MSTCRHGGCCCPRLRGEHGTQLGFSGVVPGAERLLAGVLPSLGRAACCVCRTLPMLPGPPGLPGYFLRLCPPLSWPCPCCGCSVTASRFSFSVLLCPLPDAPGPLYDVFSTGPILKLTHLKRLLSLLTFEVPGVRIRGLLSPVPCRGPHPRAALSRAGVALPVCLIGGHGLKCVSA